MLWRKVKQTRGVKSFGGWWGGVAVLVRAAREGLTEIVTLSKHLKEVRECIMWSSGKDHSKQREQHLQRPWGRACLYSQESLRKIADQRKCSRKRRLSAPKGSGRWSCCRSLTDFDFYYLWTRGRGRILSRGVAWSILPFTRLTLAAVPRIILSGSQTESS